MADRPTVLVTGGTGALGPAVVDRLLREGCRVLVLSRGGGLRPASGVTWHRGDVADRGAVARAVAGAERVFHLASLLHVANPAPELSAEYERVNVEGTRVVTEESARAGVRRLVLFSTIAVYGATPPEGADESTAPAPVTPYAASKLRGEAAALEAARCSALEVAILRPAAVYGPRVKGNYARLVRAISHGRFVPIGPGLNHRTLVHEADVAEAAVKVSEDPRAAGRLYNVSDGETHELRAIIDAICSAQGRRMPRLHVPLALARVAAAGVDGLLALGGRRAIAAPALETYCGDVIVRAERIRHELGFEARFDLRAGWRDALGARGPTC